MTASLNSLSKASSSYLRSAMHQPIQWHEWGEEAFAAAKRDNKPILLDIGAVWCHWCHVMDRESYDSPEIAQIVNERFIAVKVDRDERPDIDSRYQAAVSAISGQGGWPLTAFLTPDGKPFYGGTYFPPEDHYGRPSFKRVLLSISDAYHQKNAEVVDQAKMVESAIGQAEAFAGRSATFSPSVIDAIVKSAMGMFDDKNGGFGSAPKFPHPGMLDLIIDQYVRTGDEELRNAFVFTLEKMARGGMYDQLAGGFHRYSVDERWVVPHFEKMSYDNSELLKNYVHGYQATGSEFFAEVARDIIRWMDEWLSDRENAGFYASQDADYSMDDDGDYFTWTLEEAKAALTEEEASVAALYYDINEVGEMHHNAAKNVLHVRASLEEIAKRLTLPLARLQELLDSAKKKMYAARLQRPTPYVDKTMYVGWNALCVSAYLEAAKVLDLGDARHFALRSLDRILSQAWRTDQLLHVMAYSDAAAQLREIHGVLDDYAFTVIACLDAYEATADLSYFHFAQRIADKMIAAFFDPISGGFFDHGDDGEDTGSVGHAAQTVSGFAHAGGQFRGRDRAGADARLHQRRQLPATKLKRHWRFWPGWPASMASLLPLMGLRPCILRSHIHRWWYWAKMTWPRDLYRAAVRPFALNKSVLKLEANKVVAANLPHALAETIPQLPVVKEGKSAAVVCSNFACQPPVMSPEELQQGLKQHRKVA